jgi:hypothetical protein
MTTSRNLAVRISGASFAIGFEDHRALSLVHSVPPETLSEPKRAQQANHLIGGVRRFLANRPEFALIGTEDEMVAFAKQTGGFGNIWVKPSF